MPTVGPLFLPRKYNETMIHIKANEYNLWAWLRDSALIGMKTGVVFSTLYILYNLFIRLAVVVIGSAQSPDILSRIGWITIIVIFVGCIIGIAPSFVIGAVTAMLIGLALWIGKRWLSTFIAVTIGLAICLSLVGIIEYGIWSQVANKVNNPQAIGYGWFGAIYLSWRGIPTVIYIASGGWMGWRLFKRLSRRINLRDNNAQSLEGQAGNS